jgi:23S rRNA (cytidine1920-2'-O)/16S rRNA (cytidine1409-2'-O)-methyltransferase
VEVSRGAGIIRDPEVWARVLEEVGRGYAGHGAAMMGLMASPIRGAEGNVEFLAHFRTDTEEAPAVDIDAVVATAAVAGGG